MTVIARFEVLPVRNGSLSDDIAQAIDALDEFDIAYELTATDTVIESDEVDEVFDAVQAAHNAVESDRIITSLEIDDTDGSGKDADDRIESVASVLGREPKGDR
ncbi:MTH1187 family thiamine-binding protein [Natrialbaceae archaeon A-arb3/5]